VQGLKKYKMPEQIPEEKRFIMKRSIRKTLSVLAAIAIVTNGFGMLSQSYGIFSDSPVSVSAVTMRRQPCCTGITDQSAIQIFCDEQNYNSLCYRIINENEKTATICGSICIAYSEIKIPDVITVNGKEYKVTKIEPNAFEGQVCLEKISGAKHVEYIGQNAFKGCNNLTEVSTTYNDNRRKSLKQIDSYSFADCPNLRMVHFSDNLEQIGSYAFLNTPELFTDGGLYFDSLNYIGEGAFMNSGIKHLDISQTYAGSVREKTFSGCKNLTKIKLPENASSINKEAFADCTSLEYIYLPDSVRFIKSKAFKNNVKLTTVLMPEKLTEIGDQAFIGCESMEYIVFKNPYTTFSGGNNAGWKSFSKKNNKFVVWGNGSRTTASAFADRNGFEYKDIKTASLNVVDNNKEFNENIQKNVWNLTNSARFWSNDSGNYCFDSRLKSFYPFDYDRHKKFNGICYGLAALSVLSANDYFNISDYSYKLDLDKYSFNTPDSVTLNSMRTKQGKSGKIDFSNKCRLFATACWLRCGVLSDISVSSVNTEFVKYAEYITYGADKAELCFSPCSNTTDGHAVVCEGLEFRENLDLNQPRNAHWKNVDSKYNARILIYDVNTNSFSDEYCIYINTKTGDWYHANSAYNTSSAVGGSLRLSFKPETIFNDSSIKTKEDVNKYLGELIDAINAL